MLCFLVFFGYNLHLRSPPPGSGLKNTRPFPARAVTKAPGPFWPKCFLSRLKNNTSILKEFNAEAFHKMFSKEMEDMGLKMGQVMPLIRMALTGTMSGPPVFDIADVLGKEETIKRIEKAILSFREMVGA